MDMDTVTANLVAAKPMFRVVSPNPTDALVGPVRIAAKGVAVAGAAIHTYRSNESVACVVGDAIGRKAVRIAAKPVKDKIIETHLATRTMRRDRHRKNGMGGHSWISHPGRYDMVLVYHDANRAGPHVDIHIGRFSLVMRVPKELNEQLKFNNKGLLTENSRKSLLGYVRSQFQAGTKLPQNLDHSKSNARASWVNGDTSSTAYGSGRTRQIFSESQVDVFKASPDGPVELFSPVLDPDRGVFLYALGRGGGGNPNSTSNIVAVGRLRHTPPKLEDRLHLKLIDPKRLESLEEKASLDTSTAKYDGASAYFVITPKGTTVWSPRISVVSGERIEYTHKLDGISSITSPETIVAMGEVLFKTKPRYPWQRSEYIPAAAIGGVLNSHALLPSFLRPEVRLYRVDRVGRTRTTGLGFWENRSLQERVASLDPVKLKVAELMSPEEALLAGLEGVVVVPKGGSVNDGFKVKWWTDPHDWRITEVLFEEGPSGAVAGVVQAVSLESGKQFKLGPGQMGDTTLTRDMMANPSKYIGRVIKVESRHGHEGRAAKVLQFHDDK